MKTTIQIPMPSLTPEQLAELFWGMDDGQQAKFFNHLGVLALATPAPLSGEPGSWVPLDWQMFHAARHKEMLPLGMRAMEIIGQTPDPRLLQPYRVEQENRVRGGEVVS